MSPHSLSGDPDRMWSTHCGFLVYVYSEEVADEAPLSPAIKNLISIANRRGAVWLDLGDNCPPYEELPVYKW